MCLFMNSYFNTYDKHLQSVRRKARELCLQINQKTEGREEFYAELFGSVGDNFELWGNFFCEFGKNIHIKENVFINTNCTLLDAYDIHIGNNVLIGPNVGIYTSNHAKDIQERRAGVEYGETIKIENDVWVGGHAIILPGVTIGQGSIVGAGTIVSCSVPPFSRVLNKNAVTVCST